MSNSNLTSAKRAKNDEFYTQQADIAKEVDAYTAYNPNVFKDKVILLPCDDPDWSHFTRYFVTNFERLGLKKLISTSYAADSNPCNNYYQPNNPLPSLRSNTNPLHRSFIVMFVRSAVFIVICGG